MKKAFRHTPSEKSAPSLHVPKSRKKRTAQTVPPIPKRREGKRTHPIFHTEFAGKLIKYERPFDPVFPTEEPELWPGEKPKN